MTLEDQLLGLRTCAAITEMGNLVVLRVTGERAHGVLDRVITCDLWIRDGQVRHALILDPDGLPFADVYVGSDDGAWLVVADGPTTDALLAVMKEHGAGTPGAEVEDLSATHDVFSIDGPFSWEFVAAVWGNEVIGLPYLSVFQPADEEYFFRLGRTGEFGYLAVVPRGRSTALRARFEDVGKPMDAVRGSLEVLDLCSLENWFFNVRREGRCGASPLELQLQWRLSHRKTFLGADALAARRTRGVTRRLTAIASGGPLAVDDGVWFQARQIGTIVNAAWSPSVERHVGLAMIDLPYACAGIDRYEAQDTTGVRHAVFTVPPPFVTNVSLYVNVQRHTHALRDEVPFPGASAPALASVPRAPR